MSEPNIYPLDWETTEIKLSKGRFSHVLRRPTAEQVYKREEELQQEIPIGRDGSYSLPDPNAGEAVDAALYDDIAVSAEGYDDLGSFEFAKLHKASAVQALYAREIDIEDGADPFGDEVAITEEIGAGAEPEYTLRHILRRPKASELESYRRKTAATSQVKPGKRGRQILVTRSALRSIAAFYDQWLVRIEGASVGGNAWSEDLRGEFLNAVDPLVKRRVVGALCSAIEAAQRD